jgi:hypothetical protein
MGRGLKRVALAASTALTLAAALLVGTATAAGADPGPDLSSRAAIEQYLVSIGVDPADAVWQEGLKNYAGPSCPGLGWSCVPASAPIVQIAAPLGTNLFECSGLDCVAVQVALGAGQNGADCERVDKHGDDVVQECVIMQANTTGNNIAGINQSIEQKGADVTARQVARIEQINESGKNVAGFHQVITQSSNVKGTTQSQEAHQAATLDQMTESGDNTVNTDQRQDQSQRASGATGLITQKQNTDPGDDPFCDGSPLGTTDFDQDKNQCTGILQDSSLVSGVGGQIRSDLHQAIRESQTASDAGGVDQDQGQPPVGLPPTIFPGGQSGTVIQTSSAPDDSAAIQDMVQGQKASGISGVVDQFKSTGDPRCCATQIANTASTADIVQTTNQTASSEDAVQFAAFIGTCDSSGSCHVFQSATIDGDTDTNECDSGPPGGFCNEVRVCTEVPVGEDETETETVCEPPDDIEP